ncbi:hypothetical protein HDV06_002043 [Boothiomyces sp. JEL0866]|nr:hypothetical protein HDV06_002043 [Boothiomyces sp. JEL0866]
MSSYTVDWRVCLTAVIFLLGIVHFVTEKKRMRIANAVEEEYLPPYDGLSIVTCVDIEIPPPAYTP